MKTMFAATLALLATPVLADQPTMADLTTRVEALEGLVDGGDLGATLDYMPPALLAHLGQQAGTDAAGFKAMLQGQIREMVSSVDMAGAQYDVKLEGAEVATSVDGRPYALLETVSAFPALGVPELSTPMVALMDEETWYLVRLESQMHGVMLAQVYPDLAKPLGVQP